MTDEEPTTDQIEYAAMAAQAAAEQAGLVAITPWSATNERLKIVYQNIAKAAIDAYREGPSEAADFVRVYANFVADLRPT